VRLLVVSEGALDVGSGSGDDDGRGAVSVLLRRVLEETLGRDIADWEIERDVLPRVHEQSDRVSGYPRKVQLAIVEARARGCSSVAIVVDRDRTDGGSRLAMLRAGRSLAEAEGQPLAYHTALGVAVEMVEAWLLADEQALNETLGLAPPVPRFPDPEQLAGRPGTDTYPKTIFKGLIKRRTTTSDTPYDDVAARVRIEVIESRCRLGFAAFAEEVRERCG
jgi:hypothetical protein